MAPSESLLPIFHIIDVGLLWYSGDPVSDRLTKRTIPEYGPPFFSPKYFPIHIHVMYYQIQKADRPQFGTQTTLFQSQIIIRTKKMDQQKKIIHTFTVIYASIKGPNCGWIH